MDIVVVRFSRFGSASHGLLYARAGSIKWSGMKCQNCDGTGRTVKREEKTSKTRNETKEQPVVSQELYREMHVGCKRCRRMDLDP